MTTPGLETVLLRAALALHRRVAEDRLLPDPDPHELPQRALRTLLCAIRQLEDALLEFDLSRQRHTEDADDPF